MNIFKCLGCDGLFSKPKDQESYKLCDDCVSLSVDNTEQELAHAQIARLWAASEAARRCRRAPGRITDDEWAALTANNPAQVTPLSK